MGLTEIILGIVLLVFAVLIILVVLLQEGRQANISGAIAGGVDSFMSKNKARNWDARLARWTKFIAIGFFLLTIIVNAVSIIRG